VADDKYSTTELSDDPADYLTGPTGNMANRGSGGTTRDGQVQVINVDDSGQQTDQGGGAQQQGERSDPTGGTSPA
jgi:hypothetical protein